MQKALRYTDEKSDKFWRIETAGCELVTNWGKTGTTGRYEIKNFDTEDECEKQASKLVRSKEKKGYTDMQDFDAMHHLYFDTDEYGLHPLTSHPVSVPAFLKNCIMTAAMKKLLLAVMMGMTHCIFRGIYTETAQNVCC